MKLKPGWLDGEIVVPGQSGETSFQVLQNAFDSAKTGDIVFYVFDVPFLRRIRPYPCSADRASCAAGVAAQEGSPADSIQRSVRCPAR
jgi:hypothetical protein